MKFSKFPVKNGLPHYTSHEERFHFISHLFGVLMGIAMLLYALFQNDSHYGLISGVVFGASLIILYTASCIYHGIPPHCCQAKKTFRVIDHCSIFILIAGSGTPFAPCVLREADPKIGWGFNLFLWGVAIIGIALLVIDLERFKKLSILLYLVMGFSAMLQGGAIKAGVGGTGFSLIIAGGTVYIVGLILYSIKIRWTHAAFHVLCLIGSALHCFCVCRYVI